MRVALLCQVASVATRTMRFGVDDDPADPERLARLTRRSLRLPRADVILAGPSRACSQTATALALTTQIEGALRDLDSGRWAGHALSEIEASDPDAMLRWLGDPTATPHEGESVVALIDRVSRWLEGLAETPRSLLAITHAAVIRAAIVHALGAPASAFWRVDVPPLALAQLSGSGRRWTLTALVPPRSVG